MRSQCSRICVDTRRYGALEGIVSSRVLNASGRLGRGHWKSKSGRGSPLAITCVVPARPVISSQSGSLDLHHDACVARRDQRHVTAELNGIAESLLAVEQDRLAGDIVLPKPERLRKFVRWDSRGGSLAAPLIFDPSTLEVAGDEARQALEKMRVGMVRTQRNRSIVTRQRLIEPLQVVQRNAAIGQRLGPIRPRGKRGIVARQCLLEPSEFTQGDAALLSTAARLVARPLHVRDPPTPRHDRARSCKATPRLVSASALSGSRASARSKSLSASSFRPNSCSVPPRLTRAWT